MAKSKKVTAEPGYLQWIVRGVLGLALAVVIVLALKELGIRRQATATHAAVSDLLSNAGEDKAVLKSQIKPLIQGAPQVESADPKSLDSPAIATAERYTWQGVIRNYSMTIGYSLGEDPEVDVVVGPK